MPILAELFLVVLLLACYAGYKYYYAPKNSARAVETDLGPIEPMSGGWARGPAQHRPFKPIYHITMGESLVLTGPLRDR